MQWLPGAYSLGDFCPKGGFVQGAYILGGFCARGLISGGLLSGGSCLGGFCPGASVLDPVCITLQWYWFC